MNTDIPKCQVCGAIYAVSLDDNGTYKKSILRKSRYFKDYYYCPCCFELRIAVVTILILASSDWYSKRYESAS